LSRSVQQSQDAVREFSRGVLRALGSLDLTLTHGPRFELDRQRGHIDALRATVVRSQLLFDASGALQQALVAVSSVAVMVAGGLWIGAGTLQMESLVFFLAGLALLRGPVTTLILSAPPLAAGRRSLSKVEAFLAETATQPYQGAQPIEFEGRIELRDVTFSYSGEPLLQHLDLQLELGEVVAIIGANGAGKTTIVRLVLGLIRPQQGALRADGQGYDQLDIASLRRRFGVLTQEPVLLAGSVWDNVTYGRDGLDPAQVEAALATVGADRWLGHLSQGLETSVGDRGGLLSGGQAQQLALARALLGGPRLLILDEPTNHLDARSVERVLHGLRSGQPPTTLVISHEPRVIECADRVLALEAGQLRPVTG
jgi:ATP-binding cassette subfamily B protein